MTDLMAKDLGLAVSAAREKRVPVAVAPAAQQLYRHGLLARARARGFLLGLQIPEAVERRRSGLARRETSRPGLAVFAANLQPAASPFPDLGAPARGIISATKVAPDYGNFAIPISLCRA